MHVREYTDIEEIPPAEWKALHGACSDATVFQSYEWLSAWWGTFGAESARAAKILAAYEDSQLCGAFALYEAPMAARKSARPLLRCLGDAHADYHCLLSQAGDLAVAESLLEAVCERMGDRHDAILEEVPQFSALDLVLTQRNYDARTRVIRTGITPCPRLRLKGNESGVEAVLRKQSLRRHTKNMNQQGVVRVLHVSDPAEIVGYLPAFFDQHIQRWRRTHFPSLFENELNRRFYERLTRLLGSEGGIVFSVLSIDEVDAAYHFGLCSRADLLWYKPTFDLRLADLSPGEVLLKSIIEYAVEHDFAAVDFTRGDEPFKSRFASAVSYNSTYLLTGHRCYGASVRLHNRVRDVIRRIRSATSVKDRTVLGGAVAR